MTQLDRVKALYCEWRPPELSEVYVPGEGPTAQLPRVFVVGEAPGAQEESARRPFVGRSGQVLRELMMFADLSTGYSPYFGKGNCWLTNVVKFRPPRNRTPTPKEVAVTRHFLHQEWLAVGKPQVIICVGRVAFSAVKGPRAGSVLKQAGMPIFQKSGVVIWPMIHPSFGLRNKSVIPIVEEDWGRFAGWWKYDYNA